jgi:hypothetical protein
MTREQWSGPWCEECDTGIDYEGIGHMSSCSHSQASLKHPDQSTVRGTAFKDCMDAIDGAMAYGCRGVRKPPEGHWLASYWEMGRKMTEDDFVIRRLSTALAEVVVAFDPAFDAKAPNQFGRLVTMIRERMLELELFRAQAAGNGS